jgi:hypothetical protein
MSMRSSSTMPITNSRLVDTMATRWLPSASQVMRP